MVRIATRAELEHLRDVAGDRGIFAKYSDMRCRFCNATVFVPSWTEDAMQPWEYLPVARETMHKLGGCPECHPDLSWELSATHDRLS